MTNRRRVFELFSANTLEPEMMQTITMSAKPKDRVAVIERELENVFEEETIKLCMQILLSSNPTEDDENTEVSIALIFNIIIKLAIKQALSNRNVDFFLVNN